ncbi:hypothetical protein OFC63_31065, partial [Escherichia coli]|nr:hypothetical protein [Escherichia coli]
MKKEKWFIHSSQCPINKPFPFLFYFILFYFFIFEAGSHCAADCPGIQQKGAHEERKVVYSLFRMTNKQTFPFFILFYFILFFYF